MRDREGNVIAVGDPVLLTHGMAVKGVREGRIEHMDGAYIYVRMCVEGVSFLVERYSTELVLDNNPLSM